jgi:hypothetical protein
MEKKITLNVLFFLLIVFAAKAQNVKPEIIGTWQVASSKVNGVSQDLSNIIKMKLITDTYFTWFSCSKDNRITRNSLGGTCSYDGKVYVENIDFVGVGTTNLLHLKNVFNVEITGNKMHLTGKVKKDVYDEIWIRVTTKKSK